MLCRLTNLSSAGRVVHDINSIMRTIDAGRSIDIDLKQEAAARYVKAADMGQKIKIEVLEEGAAIIEGEAERADDPKETFTLREGDEFAAGMHPDMKEPMSLKEARGAAGNQPPPSVNPPQQPPLSQPNPVAANAERQAKEAEPVEETVKTEPTNAAELIDEINGGGLSQNDMVRLAQTILKRKLSRANQSPAAIIRLLTP